jgi:hypothetical protein
VQGRPFGAVPVDVFVKPCFESPHGGLPDIISVSFALETVQHAHAFWSYVYILISNF